MKKVIHKADTRGHSQYDWLDSYHTFSFDEYFDSDRINFGALRVLNDDKVAPGEGFQTHPHKNMEIISIPLKGHLQHGDSKKNSRIITVGEIQGSDFFYVRSKYGHVMGDDLNGTLDCGCDTAQYNSFRKYYRNHPNLEKEGTDLVAYTLKRAKEKGMEAPGQDLL